MNERSVLPRPYPRQWEDHFIRLSDELQEARGFASDRAGWEARRPLVRAALLASLGLLEPRRPLQPGGLVSAFGSLPERTALNARVTGVLERDGYRIEKVAYESRPGLTVTGALYLPALPHPAPGVFCPHGHWPDGRYNPEVQRRMTGLARRGYAVLSIDMIGYQEREPQGHRSRAPLAAGLSNQGIQLWDNLRGIDYLCARPEVDGERIGVTGCSGGGNQTMYLSALDERVKASVPVCSVELGECYMHKLFCTCETVPGLRRFADLVDVCGLIAPRALMLVHGLLDGGFRIDSARKAFERIRRIYTALGVPDRLGHFTSYDVHAYNAEMREAMYHWFDRHLKGLEPPYAPADEGPVEEPADLRVLADGLPDGRTLISLYQERAEQLPVQPVSPDEDAEPRRAQVLRVLGEWPAATPLRPHLTGSDREIIGGVEAQVESVYLYSEPDVVVPGVLYHPAGGAAVEAILRFGDGGRTGVPEEAVADDLRAGRATFAVDLRGMGETHGGGSQSDWQAYLASVTLGRHFAGMRAYDIRRCADWLLARDDVLTVAVAAHGGLLNGLTALLAAACDKRLSSLSADALLASYRGQSDFGELGDDGHLSIIPGLLATADIADLVALVAPRPVRVGRLVDALGEPVAADAASWGRARERFARLGAADALNLAE